MSIDHCVYLGPYLRCRVEMVPAVEEGRACPRPECPRHRLPADWGAFCPACGSAFARVEVPTRNRKVCEPEAAQAIREALHAVGDVAEVDDDSTGDSAFWLPNRDRPGRPGCLGGLDPENPGVTPVSGPDIAADVRWFGSAFAPEIALLAGLYGADNCDVRWGLVSYYS